MRPPLFQLQGLWELLELKITMSFNLIFVMAHHTEEKYVFGQPKAIWSRWNFAWSYSDTIGRHWEENINFENFARLHVFADSGSYIDRQIHTDTQKTLQAFRQTDVQTDRCTDRRTGRQTDRQTDKTWLIIYTSHYLDSLSTGLWTLSGRHGYARIVLRRQHNRQNIWKEFVNWMQSLFYTTIFVETDVVCTVTNHANWSSHMMYGIMHEYEGKIAESQPNAWSAEVCDESGRARVQFALIPVRTCIYFVTNALTTILSGYWSGNHILPSRDMIEFSHKAGFDKGFKHLLGLRFTRIGCLHDNDHVTCAKPYLHPSLHVIWVDLPLLVFSLWSFLLKLALSLSPVHLVLA